MDQSRKVAKHLRHVDYREKLGLTQQRIINYWSPECGIDPKCAETLYLEKLLEGNQPAPDARVLDAGCGPGGSAVWIARRFGCSVDGVDLFAPYIEIAGRYDASRVHFARADVTREPPPPETYDLVVCIAVGYLIEDKRSFFRNLIAALRPSGRLLIADHFLARSAPWIDRKVMSAIISSRFMIPLAELVQLLGEEGGRVVESRDVTKQTILASLDWLDGNAPIKDLLLGRWTPHRLVYAITKYSFHRAAHGGAWQMHFLTVERCPAP
ncbi:MAG: class I SAM-dependent methyltransferase [Thermoanaerobaculia bacterium]